MREIKFQYIYELLGVTCKPALTLEQIEEGLASKGSFPSNAKIIAKRQYTGLKDCNGVEIYEGDIVSSDFYSPEINCAATVKHNNELMGFVFDDSEQDAYVYGQLTVIGNIHQNPELIGE